VSRVSFEVTPEAKAALVAKAESMGLSLAAYARNLVRDRAERDLQAHQAELLRSIRSLLKIQVYATGRIQKLTPEDSRKWVDLMLGLYEKERSKP